MDPISSVRSISSSPTGRSADRGSDSHVTDLDTDTLLEVLTRVLVDELEGDGRPPA
ncbi:MAG TPA: hypothetical protein VFA92_01000 [Candidatus Binatia bacterium]|nr:hypothetical protein [Candidatus Binatia bacterium]